MMLWRCHNSHYSNYMYKKSINNTNWVYQYSDSFFFFFTFEVLKVLLQLEPVKLENCGYPSRATGLTMLKYCTAKITCVCLHNINKHVEATLIKLKLHQNNVEPHKLFLHLYTPTPTQIPLPQKPHTTQTHPSTTPPQS